MTGFIGTIQTASPQLLSILHRPGKEIQLTASVDVWATGIIFRSILLGPSLYTSDEAYITAVATRVINKVSDSLILPSLHLGIPNYWSACSSSVFRDSVAMHLPVC